MQFAPATAGTIHGASAPEGWTSPAGTIRAASVPKGWIGPAGTAGAAAISTIRVGGSYAVYINGHRRALITDRSPFLTIGATVTPNGARAAIIPNFDGLSGSGLVILDARSGALHTLAPGAVTSAVFTASGAGLGYAVQGKGRATVYTGTPTSAGHAVANVPGLNVSLLGWSADGRSLFASVYPDRPDQTSLPPDLVRVDTRTGTVTPVLTSNATQHRAYRDFRLVTVGGRQMLSFIRSGTGYACGNQPSEIALASLTGRIVRTFGRGQNTYTSAVWGSDGSQVAYTELACPTAAQMHSAAGKTAFAHQAAAVAGTYVASLATGQRTEVVKGISGFRLAGLDHGIVRISHDRFGVRTVSSAAVAAGRAAPLRAATLEPRPQIAPARPMVRGRHPHPAGTAPAALTNAAGFVNQVYDTPDAFDGRGSCGPSSSVMDLAGYQLSAWPMYVNAGGYHETDYGQYVTGQYTYGSVTYSWTEPDYSGNGAWPGAHGFMFIPGVGSPWSGGWGIYDYLNNHTGWAQLNGGFDSGTVENQLNQGYLVPAGGTVHGLSHVILVKGYTSDGGFVVNDPYGPDTDGGWGGADQVYYLGSDMSLWNSVAN